MSAIMSYQQFIDTIETYKNRISELGDRNKELKTLLESFTKDNTGLHHGIDDLEYKLGQYQEAAYNLCKAIHYEQPDQTELSHSTRDSISNFLSLWNQEDKKIYEEKLNDTNT